MTTSIRKNREEAPRRRRQSALGARKNATFAATASDPRWAAVLARDAEADGRFFYSVSTTGIYCRPSCGARRPRPEHVRFHATAADAEQAGFRPCKRCAPRGSSPDARRAAIVAAACRQIERAETAPTLADLAARAGLSPHHFHRVFRRVTGVTPREYALARREERVRDALEEADTVTEAIFDAGYGSAGRFYARSRDILGMAPAEYRAGGPKSTIRFAVSRCSLGSILVAATERGLCAVQLGDDAGALVHNLEERFPSASLVAGDADFDRLVAAVVALVETPRAGHRLPLDVQGTAFQRRVWQALAAIPVGETASYAEIAARIGAPRAARAVAAACAANPVAVAIPCHRVVQRDGSPGGYRWGVERKRALLAREAEARDAGTSRSRARQESEA
ncbi:MAG TPA: bifunctional DNA-binding transcriptional regulator/O6-methylguanine-DNA methyltransferase Ada [Gammaproteobacteria bacterium]